jgi:hypothetical protein
MTTVPPATPIIEVDTEPEIGTLHTSVENAEIAGAFAAGGG